MVTGQFRRVISTAPERARAVRGLLGDTMRSLRGHDVALTAAGVTFYAAIAVVPTLLVALGAARLLAGPAEIGRLTDSLAAALPDALGAPAAVRTLVTAATHLRLMTAAAALFPASLYGEGLRRAFLAVAGAKESFVGWRGRLRLLPVLALAPLLALAVMLTTPTLAHLFSSGQAGPTALGVFFALVVDWLALALPLTYTYRIVGPVSASWRAAAWSGFGTASFISGFLQGFVLFLALPLDLGAPFGGFTGIGAAVAVCLWLWVLHVVVIFGYALVLCLDERGGRLLALQPTPNT